MEKKSGFHQDFIMPVLCMAVAVWFFIQSAGVAESSRGFPLVMSVVTFLTALWNLKNAFQANTKAKRKLAEGEAVPEIITWRDLKIFGISMASLLIYALSMMYVGFFVSTAAFMLAMMRFLKCRRWLAMCLTVAVLELVIYVVFVRWLHVRFPDGLLL